MANYGLYEKPYIRLGHSGDVCYCCVKEECSKGSKDAYDVTHDLTGKQEDKMIFHIRRNAQDTCICFDCFKRIYEDIIQFEMQANAPIEIDEPTTEDTASKEEESKKPTKKTTK